MIRVAMLSVLCGLLSLPSFGQSLGEVAQIQEQRLEQAKQRYQQVTETLRQQRAPLFTQLNQLEGELTSLRQKLAGATRIKDEQFLSLESMQERLGQWQQQNRYVGNLLERYLSRRQGSEADRLNEFTVRLQALEANTTVAWRPQNAIATDGRLLSGDGFSAGPLAWFRNVDGQIFVADRFQQPAVLVMPLPGAMAVESEQWVLPVDISRDKATRIAASDKGVVAKLERGGLWIYPIIGLGVVALILAIGKLLSLLRLQTLQPRMAAVQLESEDALSTDGWQAELCRQAWELRGHDREQIGERLHRQLLLWKRQLDSKMVFIAATAAVAPLLGLLGTVSGMIHTFEMMNLFGNKDQNLLAGGISEALVTTELGLMVAIPALLIHAFLSRRHQAYLAQLETDALLLSDINQQPKEATS